MTDGEELIIALLAEIRDELRILTAPDAEEEGDCPHPEEARASLSSAGDPNHWVCKLCRYDNKAGPPMN